MPPCPPREITPAAPIAIAIHKARATGFIVADPLTLASLDALFARQFAFTQALFATVCTLLAGLIAPCALVFVELLSSTIAILRLLTTLISLTGE